MRRCSASSRCASRSARPTASIRASRSSARWKRGCCSFDLVVLGGLNEGTWPQAAAADPWFSRPMRKALGLEQPERAIGLAAHDFATLAAGPRVLLTRALKSEGAPTIASRWLQRLMQLTGGLGLANRLEPPHRLSSPSTRGSRSPGPRRASKRPAPTPPVEARPRALSVTEIETWLRDPYAIYARRVLGLRAARSARRRDRRRWSAASRCTRRWSSSSSEFPDALPADAERRLVAIADEMFAERHAESGAGAVAAALRQRGALVRRRRARAPRRHRALASRDQGRSSRCTGALHALRPRRPHRRAARAAARRSSTTRPARRRPTRR